MRISKVPLAALLIGLSFASSIAAHDFWVQPAMYWPALSATTPITLQVGHGADRGRSPIRIDRIVRFDAIAADGAVVDLRSRLHPDGSAEDGAVRFDEAGSRLLVLQTDARAQSHLPAIRFNDYLEAEGLTPAIEQRRHAQRMDVDGSENYRRVAKTIVQVGPPDANAQSHITRALGLPLEIVPEQSPYAEPRSASLPLHVIYEGRPLPGALVKLTNLEHDAAPVETRRTDEHGRANFTMPGNGSWLLNVVWTRALPASSETEFETTFSSLSFGFAM